jgi:catalase
MTITPERAVDAANEVFGRHPGYRAFHAKGTLCQGTFTAAPTATQLTRAAHMQGDPVPVTVRVSNGSGDPNAPDNVQDVRGLAVKFELSDGGRTDMVAQSLPWFAFHDPDGFVELVLAQKRDRSMVWRFPAYLVRHPRSIAALRVNGPALRVPESYFTLSYYGVHAFRWVAADGSSRYVRWEWVPLDGDRRLGLREARSRGRDFLREGVRDRLARGPARFTLELQIAGAEDPVDDPSQRWPAERERVDAGTLEIVDLDEATDENSLVFDPGRLIDGIELTDDAVLQFRPRAYSESVSRRLSS